MLRSLCNVLLFIILVEFIKTVHVISTTTCIELQSYLFSVAFESLKVLGHLTSTFMPKGRSGGGQLFHFI